MHMQIGNLNFEGQNIYAGFDLQLKSLQVTILTDCLKLKTFVMPSNSKLLNNYLRENYPEAVCGMVRLDPVLL